MSDFFDGTVDKNASADAEDIASIPHPGRSKCCGATKPVLCNYWAFVLEMVSYNTEPMCCNYGRLAL